MLYIRIFKVYLKVNDSFKKYYDIKKMMYLEKKPLLVIDIYRQGNFVMKIHKITNAHVVTVRRLKIECNNKPICKWNILKYNNQNGCVG